METKSRTCVEDGQTDPRPWVDTDHKLTTCPIHSCQNLGLHDQRVLVQVFYRNRVFASESSRLLSRRQNYVTVFYTRFAVDDTAEIHARPPTSRRDQVVRPATVSGEAALASSTVLIFFSCRPICRQFI